MPLPTYRPRRKGVAPRFESLFTAEIAEAIRGRVAAGEAVTTICRSPGMPCYGTVYRWMRIYPDWGKAMAWARQAGRRVRAGRVQARRAERDAAHEARRKWRWTRPAWNARYSPALGSEVCRRLALGESLTAICRDQDMPSIGTVYNWMNAHPEFAEIYGHARAIQNDRLQDQVTELFERLTRWKRPWAKRRFKQLRLAMAKLAAKGWGLDERPGVTEPGS